MQETDVDLIPGSGRSPGGGHGNPLQYSCLENLMEKKFPKHTSHSSSSSQLHVTAMGTMEKENFSIISQILLGSIVLAVINMFLGSCVLHYLAILLIATIFSYIFFNIIPPRFLISLFRLLIYLSSHPKN